MEENKMKIINLNPEMIKMFKEELDHYQGRDSQSLFDDISFVLGEFFYDQILDLYHKDSEMKNINEIKGGI